ncbi:MAG TPA: hypothetical protein VED87_07660 [Methylocystis sp.]|nr:hypothetical protein [Methylocystis sp.]
MSKSYVTTARAIAAVVFAGCIAAALPTSDALAGVVSLGQAESVKLEAPVTTVHWRPYPHHHWRQAHWGHAHWGQAPVFTNLVDAGVVSYPVYRIDHYKIDYTAPTYTYTEKCGGWLW